MRFELTPTPLLHLITTILLAPRPIAAKPHPNPSAQNGFTFNELFARYECNGGDLCGWNKQLCCPAGGCYTNQLNQAACSTGGSYYSSAAPAGGGYWVYQTSVMTRTDLVTIATVYSSYVPASSAGLQCNYALNESPCGNCCCRGGEYCAYYGQCSPAAPGQTTVRTNAATPGAPIRPNSSGVVVATVTQSPTETISFLPPAASGANITMAASQANNSGLSGGEIAGIVIGVLVGLLILGLICFYCCLKGLLDGCLALFGLGGRKRKRTTEVEEYERRSHHGGRTWYGAAKPSRIEKREKRSSGFGKEALGLAGGLGALWAILGMKRRHDRKKDSRYGGTDSSYSYSYTSTSK